MESKKIAIILLGPPGAGKTTQAQKLAEEFNLIHFNTGEVMREILYDPENQNDPIIAREKQLYESGALNTDEWAINLVIEKARLISRSGKGVVYSGSPRRLSEAEALLPVLEELYGKENIFAFIITLDFDTVARRMEKRHVCSKCGLPVVPGDDFNKCRKCGGDITVRTLDDPGKFKKRFEEYTLKTQPVINFIRSTDIMIHDINQDRPALEVHKEMADFVRQYLQ